MEIYNKWQNTTAAFKKFKDIFVKLPFNFIMFISLLVWEFSSERFGKVYYMKRPGEKKEIAYFLYKNLNGMNRWY